MAARHRAARRRRRAGDLAAAALPHRRRGGARRVLRRRDRGQRRRSAGGDQRGETDDEGWALDGFRPTTGSETNDFDNFYIASHRTYTSFDRYLETGPYNFGFLDQRPDFVEHFPYQQGLLVSYWDTSQSDNNTSEHPGEGEILPIDAHPRPILNGAGQPWRSRIQVYDAPFSLRKADSFTLHVNSQPHRIRGAAAQPVFDDSRSYWDATIPQVGVKVPNAGVRMRVLRTSGTAMWVRVSG